MKQFVKVYISARELARQLPEIDLHVLGAYNGDDHLYFRAVMAGGNGPDIGSKEERFPILIEYPHFFGLFTQMELRVMSAMYGKERTLADFEYEIWERNTHYNQHGTTAAGNLVSVHKKNIVAKLKKHHIPLEMTLVSPDRRNGFWTFRKKVVG